ncbi:MAG: DUF3631 domain-containing protein [Solirubrobacterales bacterium]|nr:DUF3631 domain-containing protein [Solirubrobacterales bacterium]
MEFSTFCAKALAGIGALPDTIADRGIPIRLERKTGDESVERFIHRDVEPEGKAIRIQLAAWAKSQDAVAVATARPAMPAELSDRMQEGCEILVAIADSMGDGQSARDSLVKLLTGERLDEQGSLSERLLNDVKLIFGRRDKSRGERQVSISTTDLIEELVALDEAPWAVYFGRAIDARDIAKLVREYGIKSKTVRLASDGSKTRKGVARRERGTAKGYGRDDFEAVWTRYL